jgi:hypothetical protein
MKCENCGKEFFEDWRRGTHKDSPRFCSKHCSQSRHWSVENKAKLSEKLKRREDRFCETCGHPLSATASRKKVALCKVCLGLTRRGTGKYGIEAKNWGPYIKAVREARKKEYIHHAGGKCVKCGYDKYYGAFDFHHKDPTKKKFGLTGNGLGHSEEEIEEELQKCILLCCRCHRELHEEMRQGKTLDEFLTMNVAT